MTRRPSNLTKALLETAEGMNRVGLMSDDSYRKIIGRHIGLDAPLSAGPIRRPASRTDRQAAAE